MIQPLRNGAYYHIYTRGNNRADLFREERNYRYFLSLYHRHIAPVAETYAYCLLRNHVHLLIRTRDSTPKTPSQAFSNLFNAYARAFNKVYRRTDALFQRPLRRIEVTNEGYLLRLVVYIHHNPERHGLIHDFREWPYSSYHALTSAMPTLLQRESVIGWFEGLDQFVATHARDDTMPSIEIAMDADDQDDEDLSDVEWRRV